MIDKTDKSIRPEWTEYYKTLETIRESGVTNMFGAGPYLVLAHKELSLTDANAILCNWIHNYAELVKQGIIIRKGD